MHPSEPTTWSARAARAGCGGFTFIELLVTIALLGIIMPVAMRTIGICTRLGGESRRQMEAASLAKTKLSELIVTGDWENGNQQGEFDEDDWADYKWSATVTNWTDTSVRLVELTVTWQSMGRQRGVTLSTLMYPEES
ncbi:MAG: type II secretion system protein [Phycisphaerae bacterium]|nr:type II secretion system protein [Phycisphaerae bacterium]